MSIASSAAILNDISDDDIKVDDPSLRRRRPTSPELDGARICRQLRELAVNGRFRPGQRLQISEIANQLVVSSTPVREALVQLSAEGLVKFEPGKGFFCKMPTLSELMDCYDALEVLVICAATKSPESRLPTCWEMVVEEPWNDERALAFARCLERCYKSFVNGTGSQLFSRLIGNLLDITHFLRVLSCESIEDARQSAEELTEVKAHFQANDAEGFVRSLGAHFSNRQKMLPELIREGIARWYIKH